MSVFTPNKYLGLIRSFQISPNLKLHILQGSVCEFASPTGAIVNAANEGCLGGGGVDGAITAAGGPDLHEDRLALPILEEPDVRCPTGSAVVTGPSDSYGSLRTPYIIHAVGPNYWTYIDEEEANELLKSAYCTSLRIGEEKKLTNVAFSLLSAGIFRGHLSLKEVLKVSVLGIHSWALSEPPTSLRDIYMCGFTDKECRVLEKVCAKIFGDAGEDVSSTTSEENGDVSTTNKDNENNHDDAANETSNTSNVSENDNEGESKLDDSPKEDPTTGEDDSNDHKGVANKVSSTCGDDGNAPDDSPTEVSKASDDDL